MGRVTYYYNSKKIKDYLWSQERMVQPTSIEIIEGGRRLVQRGTKATTLYDISTILKYAGRTKAFYSKLLKENKNKDK